VALGSVYPNDAEKRIRQPPTENRPSNIEDSPDRPLFWNDMYAGEDALFGTAPNAFVRAEAGRIPEGACVAEVGAGEGRNLLFLAKERGARVTAVDFASDALSTARRRAEDAGVTLETIVADARGWQPEQPFDAVVVTFLHLLPAGRVESYRRLRDALAPGGVLVAEWFSAAYADKDRFAEIGPSGRERLIATSELREHFSEDGIAVLEETERFLDEGPVLRGRAAVLWFVWRKPER